VVDGSTVGGRAPGVGARRPGRVLDALVEADWELPANKTGATRLGFASLLKFFELEGRFPRHVGEIPKQDCTSSASSAPPTGRVVRKIGPETYAKQR
jgi:hypothetical protein